LTARFCPSENSPLAAAAAVIKDISISGGAEKESVFLRDQSGEAGVLLLAAAAQRALSDSGLGLGKCFEIPFRGAEMPKPPSSTHRRKRPRNNKVFMVRSGMSTMRP
jgi:hypothetical protein